MNPQGNDSKQPQRAPGALGLIRLFGVPVRFHFTFWLVAVWLIYIGVTAKQSVAGSGLYVLILFLSVLFHEAGHVLLHGRRDGFLEEDRKSDSEAPKDAKEEQADQFARDFLIPPSDYERIIWSHKNNSAVISRFARSLGIAPGIVVGRLQHDNYLPKNYCNELRRPLEWAKPGSAK